MTAVPETIADQPVCDAQRAAAGATQIVLVFQGGGALGAYQAGVYQALHEAGIKPDWIIGTSIGAINASLIAGNSAQDRIPRLQEFWRRVQRKGVLDPPFLWPEVRKTVSDWMTLLQGVPGLFSINPLALLGTHYPMGADRAGYYSMAPLKATLSELVDFSLLGQCPPRLTVGAANVRTSAMHYFDSREMTLTMCHVLASAALPPAFPPVWIDNEYYWDGGILSNTPIEAIFDDVPRRDSIVFAVNVWDAVGPEPNTIWEVLHRHKDIQYSSRVANHIAREQQVHRLRHVITELVDRMPAHVRSSPRVRDLAGYGCVTRMHVVTLLAPRLKDESHTKDIDFSESSIQMRWDAGYSQTTRVLEESPWKNEFDPVEGVIIHEPVPIGLQARHSSSYRHGSSQSFAPEDTAANRGPAVALMHVT
jgi:NTE family protein